MTFRFPKKLPQEWIKQLENLSVNTRFKSMRVAGRDRRGTILHLGGDAYKILRGGKNSDVFGNPLVGEGLDPNFGYEIKGGLGFTNPPDVLRGSWFSCPEFGKAESITAYLMTRIGTPRVKCAIYKKTDNSLVGHTKELVIPEMWEGWKTFSIIFGGFLEATDYWLIVWNSLANVSLFYDPETGKAGVQGMTYDSFPDFWSPRLEDYKFSIYCTYTPAPLEHVLTVESTPITGIPVTIDGVEVGSTPVSTMVSEGDHTVSIPSEQERSKRR